MGIDTRQGLPDATFFKKEASPSSISGTCGTNSHNAFAAVWFEHDAGSSQQNHVQN